MFSHILVSYDGSKLAQQALEVAADMAQKYDAKLTVLHVNVIPGNLRTQAATSEALQDLLDESGRKHIVGVQEYLEKTDLTNYKVTFKDAPSAPKAVIKYAKKHDVDLIVMGSRGMGSVKQYFGSVSNAILGMAKIPVMVIKDPK